MGIFWSSVEKKNSKSSISGMFSDGETFSVPSTHPRFDEISLFLETMPLLPHDGDNNPEEQLRELISIATTVSNRLTKLSERVSSDGSTIYFDNDPIDSSIAAWLLNALKQENISGAVDKHDGDDDTCSKPSWRAIVNFLEKLYQNPSTESIQHLYSFIQRTGLTLRENGDFIAFKGLRHDYTSIHAGPGVVQGEKFANAHLNNSPGNVVEIPRSYVETSREYGCAQGLHVGSFEYAKDFADGALVSVSVNPRDVVSVPSDQDYQKCRVSRYEVLSDIPGDFTHDRKDIIWDDNPDDSDEDWDDEELVENNEADDFAIELDKGCMGFPDSTDTTTHVNDAYDINTSDDYGQIV